MTKIEVLSVRKSADFLELNLDIYALFAREVEALQDKLILVDQQPLLLRDGTYFSDFHQGQHGYVVGFNCISGFLEIEVMMLDGDIHTFTPKAFEYYFKVVEEGVCYVH